MANLPETLSFPPVPAFEGGPNGTRALGGDESAPANLGLAALTARTAWLKASMGVLGLWDMTGPLPVGAADGRWYQVSASGTFGGRAAVVGDFVMFYANMTRIVVVPANGGGLAAKAGRVEEVPWDLAANSTPGAEATFTESGAGGVVGGVTLSAPDAEGWQTLSGADLSSPFMWTTTGAMAMSGRHALRVRVPDNVANPALYPMLMLYIIDGAASAATVMTAAATPGQSPGTGVTVVQAFPQSQVFPATMAAQGLDMPLGATQPSPLTSAPAQPASFPAVAMGDAFRVGVDVTTGEVFIGHADGAEQSLGRSSLLVGKASVQVISVYPFIASPRTGSVYLDASAPLGTTAGFGGGATTVLPAGTMPGTFLGVVGNGSYRGEALTDEDIVLVRESGAIRNLGKKVDLSPYATKAELAAEKGIKRLTGSGYPLSNADKGRTFVGNGSLSLASGTQLDADWSIRLQVANVNGQETITVSSGDASLLIAADAGLNANGSDFLKLKAGEQGLLSFDISQYTKLRYLKTHDASLNNVAEPWKYLTWGSYVYPHDHQMTLVNIDEGAPYIQLFSAYDNQYPTGFRCRILNASNSPFRIVPIDGTFQYRGDITIGPGEYRELNLIDHAVNRDWWEIFGKPVTPVLPDVDGVRNVVLTGGIARDESAALSQAFEAMGAAGGGLLTVRSANGVDPIYIGKVVSLYHSNVQVLFLSGLIYGPTAGLRLMGELDEFSREPNGYKLGLRAASTVDANGRLVLSLKTGQGAYLQVGDKIIVRGLNDSTGRTLEKQVTFVVALAGDDVTCSDEPDYTFQATYPGSDWPSDATSGTTLTVSRFARFTGDVAVGAIAAVVSNASYFSVGELVYLSDARVEKDINPDSPYYNAANMEYVRVTEVDTTTNTVKFDRGLMRDYKAAFYGGVSKVLPVRNSSITLQGVTFDGDQTTKNPVLMGAYVEDCFLSAHRIIGYAGRRGQAMRLAYGYNSKIKQGTVNGAKFFQGGEGYGATLYYSTGCVIEDVEASGCRHNILLQATTSCKVRRVKSYDDWVSGLDLHGGNCIDTEIEDVDIGRADHWAGVTTSAGLRIGNSSHVAGDHKTRIKGLTLRGYQGSAAAALDIAAPCSQVDMEAVLIEDCSGGVRLYPNRGDIPTQTAKDWLLKGVTFRRVADPLLIAGGAQGQIQRLTLQGCTSDGNSRHFKLANVQAVTLLDNAVINPVASAGEYAFDLSGCTQVRAHGNQAGAANRGLKLTNCPAAIATGNEFAHTTEGVAYSDGGGNTGAEVRNNGEPVASGPTLTYVNGSLAADTTSTAAVPHNNSTPLATDGLSAVATSYAATVGRKLRITAVVPYVSLGGSSGPVTAHLFAGGGAVASTTKRLTASGTPANSSGDGFVLVSRVLTVTSTPVAIDLRIGPDVATNTIGLNSKFNGGAMPYLMIEEFA